MIKRALISVYDKSNLEKFVQFLHKENVEIISSGGTASYIKSLNIPVLSVSDYTGSPEILDGRVKTLHPKIFGGILAKNARNHQIQLYENDIKFIDLVVVNLYPFAETVKKESATNEEIIEMIDVGGPSLVRAAAKNYDRVIVIVDTSDYYHVQINLVLNKGFLSLPFRQNLAHKAFCYTSAYDSTISNYFFQVVKNYVI